MGPPGWTAGPRGHPQLGDAVGEQVTITSVSQPPRCGYGMGAPFASDHVAGGGGRGMEPRPGLQVGRHLQPGCPSCPTASGLMPHLVSLLPTSMAGRRGQYLLWGSLPRGIEGASRLCLQVAYGLRAQTDPVGLTVSVCLHPFIGVSPNGHYGFKHSTAVTCPFAVTVCSWSHCPFSRETMSPHC